MRAVIQSIQEAPIQNIFNYNQSNHILLAHRFLLGFGVFLVYAYLFSASAPTSFWVTFIACFVPASLIAALLGVGVVSYDFEEKEWSLGFLMFGICAVIVIAGIFIASIDTINSIEPGEGAPYHYIINITGILFLGIAAVILKTRRLIVLAGFLFGASVLLSFVSLLGGPVYYTPGFAIISGLLALLGIEQETVSILGTVRNLSFTMAKQMRAYPYWWIGGLALPFLTYGYAGSRVIGVYLFFTAFFLLPDTDDTSFFGRLRNIFFCLVAYKAVVLVAPIYASYVTGNATFALRHANIFALYSGSVILLSAFIDPPKRASHELGIRFLITPITTIWLGILMLTCTMTRSFSPLFFAPGVALIVGGYFIMNSRSDQRIVTESLNDVVKATPAGDDKGVVLYRVKPFLHNALEEDETVIEYKGHLFHAGTLTHIGQRIQEKDAQASTLAL